MKKYILYIVCSIILGDFAFGQSVPLLSEYMLNDFVYNPAMGGQNGQPLFNVGYRTQWVGFGDHATRFFYVSGNGTIHDKGSLNDVHDIGGYMYTDAIGIQQTRGVNASYAFHKGLSEDMSLSLGTFLGVSEYSYDPNVDLPDGAIFDPAVFTSFERTTTPDGTIGSVFRTKDFYAGLSVKQIFGGRYNYNLNGYKAINKLRRHWYVMGGYDFLLSSKFMVSPSLLFKGVRGSRAQLDVNAKLDYKDLAFIGVSYRTNNTMSFILGFDVPNVGEFGYAYDAGLGAISRTNGGSHELLVTFRFEDFRRMTKFQRNNPAFGH